MMGNSNLFSVFEVLPASCCFSLKTFLDLGNLRASSILLSTFERLSLGFVGTRCCFGSEKPASSLFSRFTQHCIARYAPSFRTAICSTTEVNGQRGANPFKIARNEFIEPTIKKKFIITMAAKKSFALRIDTDVFDAIEKWAADEYRSSNGQLEWIIAEALKKAKRYPKKAQNKDSSNKENLQ